MMATSHDTTESPTKSDTAKRTKTTKTGRTKTVSKAKPAAAQRSKRAEKVAAKAQETRSTRAAQSAEKGLADLLEHGLRDMYYAEKKIFRALPKMIKAAEDEMLVEALEAHRQETQGQIETLETIFDLMGLRARGEKCDAIDGILAEGDGILEDFGGTLAADAAIIFSCHAVEHYEIARYSAMAGFADALGLDEVRDHLQQVLDQETAAESKLTSLAEGSINEAASEYDSDDD